MTGTLWNERLIEWDNPRIFSTATYGLRRDGDYIKINVDISSHCGSSGDYRNNRWACDVIVNGVEISSNLTIKGVTSGTIGTHVYSASTGEATVYVGNTDSIAVSIYYYDTGFSYQRRIYDSFSTQTADINNIPSLPSISLSADYSYPNMTNNSLVVNYSITGGSCDYITVYVDGNSIGDKISSPFTITGLSSNANHNVYVRGYGNGGYGNASNTLSFNTFVDPTYVGSFSVNNIQPFSCTTYCYSNNATNTNYYEYSLCDSNKNLIQGPFVTNLSYYNLKSLNEETSYYIRYRVQTVGSNVWSNYVYSGLFKTPADQASGYYKVNGAWTKGKMFVKINGVWVKAKKTYIKENNKWIITKNN